jgi:hypothetical protein
MSIIDPTAGECKVETAIATTTTSTMIVEAVAPQWPPCGVPRLPSRPTQPRLLCRPADTACDADPVAIGHAARLHPTVNFAITQGGGHMRGVRFRP